MGGSVVHRPVVSSGGVYSDAAMLGLHAMVVWQGEGAILRVCGYRSTFRQSDNADHCRRLV